MQAIVQFAMGRAGDGGVGGRRGRGEGERGRGRRRVVDGRTRRHWKKPCVQNGQPVLDQNSLNRLTGTVDQSTAQSHPLTVQPIVQSTPEVVQPCMPALQPNLPSHNMIKQPVAQFPNATAIKSYKIPKRKSDCAVLSPSKKTTSDATFVLPTSRSRARRTRKHLQLISSDCVLSDSVMYQRHRALLPTNPHTLSFTLVSSDGQCWTNTSLEGEL